MRIPRKTNNGRSPSMGNMVATRPPIPLIPVEELSSKTDEAMKFKLLSVPGEKDHPRLKW
jgi:hypothetical protein